MEKKRLSFPYKTTTMPILLYLNLVLFLAGVSCSDTSEKQIAGPGRLLDEKVPATDVRGISLPPGFSYVDAGDTTYSNWLLDLKLKKDKTVYLHNGEPKANQYVQYGVLDIPIGKKNLLQCADAAIKLRAGFLYEQGQFNKIKFRATSGDELSFESWLNGVRWKEQKGKLVRYTIRANNSNLQDQLNSFLEIVFSYSGTYSLSRQLKQVNHIDLIQPGDVFVHGGFPGHAVTVMAVVKNERGNKLFLLSQGYMPAQDIHVLKNYTSELLSPWYNISEIFPLYTPEWTFEKGSLRRW